MRRTRVAPLKKLPIVRLELQAAVLAVHLVDALRKEILSQLQKVTYRTDSKVILPCIGSLNLSLPGGASLAEYPDI